VVERSVERRHGVGCVGACERPFLVLAVGRLDGDRGSGRVPDERVQRGGVRSERVTERLPVAVRVVAALRARHSLPQRRDRDVLDGQQSAAEQVGVRVVVHRLHVEGVADDAPAERKAAVGVGRRVVRDDDLRVAVADAGGELLESPGERGR